MSLRALLGLEPGDVAPARRLGLVIGLLSLADFLVEGAVTSTFLARVGASHLPAALAARALVEVVLSLAYGRIAPRLGPSRALAIAALGSAGVLGAAASVLGAQAGVVFAFVVASAIARLKVIHFGVLALAELPGPSAARALPAVYACARLGAIAAGPLLALFSGLGLALAIALGAVVYAAGSLVLALGASAREAAVETLPFAEEAVPSLGAVQSSARRARGLLPAIVVGAVALAVGRLALTTQSGAILQAHYAEAELARVLGSYFAIANAIGFVLQLFVVGRVLGAGGLPILNTGWSALYVAAQLLLAFGPASVAVALGGRLVESELRNAARTPVANLLYEGLPAERRAHARTLVIGVSIPLASLAAGIALALSSKSALVLSTVGVSAAIVLLFATLAQNQTWRRALGTPDPQRF